MAFFVSRMRGFGSKMYSHVQLRSRISHSQHSNFCYYNASPRPVTFSVSCASYRRYFSAEDDRTKNLRPLFGAIPHYVRTDPANLEETFVTLTEMVVKNAREHGTILTLEVGCSIRRRILELETQLAPELDDPKMVVDDPDNLPISYLYYWLYTQEKWSMILQKKDNPRVKQLIELIEKAEISQDVFCQSLSQFSFTPSKDNHRYTRPLAEFDPDEIEIHLQRQFGKKHAEIVFHSASITRVIMKI